jgi:hypothetical protein
MMNKGNNESTKRRSSRVSVRFGSFVVHTSTGRDRVNSDKLSINFNGELICDSL